MTIATASDRNGKMLNLLSCRNFKGRSQCTVTSGELLWGQMTPILSGLTNDAHDFPSTEDRAVLGGTIVTQAYTYRAPARMGLWKIIKVNGYGHPKAPKDSWLVYHSSCDPLELRRPVGCCAILRGNRPRGGLGCST
ncbi:hypothetical protein B0H19DRAFT_482288 [Mycena capillaripes]|nr:hypothetical protein B0H19DRAFT_482288 [Mycena capillaripes]